jgi:hypothetical protein
MQQPYNMMQPPQKDMSPAQANVSAMNQAAAHNTAMQGAKSQNAPAMASGREVMRRPAALQSGQGVPIAGQAVKTGISPENRNIKQTMGTGIIAAQMNRPA